MDAKTRPWRSALSILSAALLILAHPPWGAGPLAGVALVPLVVALAGAGLRSRLALGWLCGSLWSFGMVGPWLWPAAESALGWGSAASLAVAVAAVQLYGGLHVAVFAGLAGRGGHPSWPLRVALAWVASEALRSPAFAGIPWGLLGHALWSYPAAIQSAAAAGVAAVSFWLALLNSMLAAAAVERAAGRSGRRLVVGALVLVCLVLGLGALRIDDAPTNGGFDVQVVHSDWPSLGPSDARELLRHMVERTLEGGEGAEVTVWPEAALRVLPTAEPELAHSLLALARERGRDIVLGAPRAGDGVLYNALLALRPGERDFLATYDKRRLVPLAEAHFAAGGEPAPLRVGRDRVWAPLLCFEALFPDLVASGSIDLLINPTNDVRVGHGAQQQSAMAVFRSVENGIPLLRVANRGPSVLVDGYGRIVARGDGWGSPVWRVPPALEPPPHRRIVSVLRKVVPPSVAGEGPLPWVCLIAALGWAALRRTDRRAGGEQ